MVKLENTEVLGWEHAIRGMRNPMNSWEKSDSKHCTEHYSCDTCPANANSNGGKGCIHLGTVDPMIVGPNDHTLMMNLAHGGPVHAKYRRMITVYVDITAPLYWWKEFDTYKVGTVANSCSTMHKIHAKEFTLEDFSTEHLLDDTTGPQVQCDNCEYFVTANSMDLMKITINVLNHYRGLYLLSHDKKYWWQMIQLLPTSYNQKRTVMLNYEVLVNMYDSRKLHKLDEWRELCKWIEKLPYSELIIGEKNDEV